MNEFEVVWAEKAAKRNNRLGLAKEIGLYAGGLAAAIGLFLGAFWGFSHIGGDDNSDKFVDHYNSDFVRFCNAQGGSAQVGDRDSCFKTSDGKLVRIMYESKP